MEDKIYVKKEESSVKDGVWEINPALGFGLYIMLYLIIFFGSIFLFVFIGIPTFLLAMWLIFISIYLIVKTVLVNQSRNMSASTAFIERDGILYAIQLLYTKKELGTETSRNMIYMPTGTILQAATLKNNFDVAKDVQAHEKEVRERRKNIVSFSIALDDILKYLDEKPKAYSVLPNSKRSKLDNLFMYNIENGGMKNIITKNASYNFLILNNPKVTNENKKNFTIEFYNQNNEICSAKFSNCYDKLIENIKNN